jgi:hypothetical protein
MAMSITNSTTLPTNKRVLNQENFPLYTDSAKKNNFEGNEELKCETRIRLV